MEKLKMETPSGAQELFAKLAKLVPECVVEKQSAAGGGRDNNLTHAIDFDKLKQLLDGRVREGEEAYEFTWVGKKAALVEANTPIQKTLRPVKEESKDWDTTENLYIEGDNLDALKLLQESYLGKVKMIYIDPPYNTGNDAFIYNDKFQQDAESYERDSGNIDEEGNRLINKRQLDTDGQWRDNPKSNGRFHSDWCSMIYPRLLLARNLLADDGVIFISIDDNEIDNLKNICNEIFGEVNRVAEIPWQSRASVQNDTDFSVNHEYICVYAKNRRQENRRLKESNFVEWHKSNGFVCKPLPLSKEKFDNPDDDPRGPWKADPLDAPNVRPNLTYPIINPYTGEKHLPPRGRCWRFSPEKFSSAMKDNRIVWNNNGKGRPQLKVFYEEKKELGTIETSWFDAVNYGTTTQGTKEEMKLFDGAKCFSMPKPVLLIRRLLRLANLKSDSIVLDFFSGSATTAQAVMETNIEESMHRKFIMVQLPEATDEKSEAYKAGYKNICEIGKERIRRAGAKILAEHPEAKDLDTGFRVLRVDSSNMKDVYYRADEVTQASLLDAVDNVKENRSALDLLFGCLVDWGLPLSLPYAEETIAGVPVLNYSDGDLIACFAAAVPEAAVRAIAELQPLRAVFRDSSFVDSPARINVEEIFRLLSPDTELRVL